MLRRLCLVSVHTFLRGSCLQEVNEPVTNVDLLLTLIISGNPLEKVGDNDALGQEKMSCSLLPLIIGIYVGKQNDGAVDKRTCLMRG